MQRLSNPFQILDGRCTIHIGDVFDRLRDMPDNFVDLVVTSPPYWGLRDYGTAFWVDGDPNCDHRPTAMTRTPWANRIKGPTNPGKHGWHEISPARDIGGYCVHCGARRVDYQIGMENTLGQHIDVLVEVFAEVHRVLKPTGALFLNYGDCYAAEPNGRSASATKAAGDDDRTFRDKPFSTVGPIYEPHYASPRGVFTSHELNARQRGTRRVDHGRRVVAGGTLKPKDLCMIPNRLAIALQEWGWWVRSEIVWGKKNPMPDSSGRGRPSTSHEKIFLLTKSIDADIWVARDTGDMSFKPDLTERCKYVSKRDPVTGELLDGARRWIRLGSYYDASAVMQPSSPNTHPRIAQNVEGQAGSDRAHAGTKANGPMKAVASKIVPAGSRGVGRLLRNFETGHISAPLPVWHMATVPYKEAHFATFPPELVERAIACGAPPDGGVVLDPFGGAGTTALVALRMGRRAHLIELKPEYVDMTIRRIERDWMGEDERKRVEAKERIEAGAELEPLPLLQEAAE